MSLDTLMGFFIAMLMVIVFLTGMSFYNDVVVLNPLGTAMLRASNCMKNKKLVKVHQNILIFKKGNK